MNDIEQFLVEMGQLRDETFVRQAAAAMVGLLTAIDDRWPTSGLRRHCFQHGTDLGNYLRNHPGFVAVTCRAFAPYGAALAESEVFGDPTTLMDLSAYVAQLADHLPDGLPSPAKDEAREAIHELQPRMAADLIHAVRPQALRLAEVVWQISHFASRLPAEAHVHILEFPLGNSIPSKLLDRILKHQGRESHIVRVSLSRNDKRSQGLTRKQLLDEKLEGTRIEAGNLVVLVDEWLSGSNFRNLTEHLERACATRGAAFLPVGMLMDGSTANTRFESHAAEHDRMLGKLGEDGGRWRVEFPRLGTRFKREGYFFWSEYDRIAGYRKFKIIGSHVSTMSAVLKRLREDKDAMRQARIRLLATVAEARAAGEDAPEVSARATADGGIIDRLFTESYEDYLRCEAQLREIEDATNRGEVGDIIEDLRRVAEKIHEVIDGRPAKICLLLAFSYIDVEHIVDPEDRYFLDGHAPVIVELGGGFGRWSELVIGELEALTLSRWSHPLGGAGRAGGGRQPADDALTSTEHQDARVRAYYFALERGGGRLPSYDPNLAADDFNRAAGIAIAGRASRPK